MFFFLSKLLDVLLSPLTWALALVTLAIPWRRPPGPDGWRRRRAAGIAGALVLVVFGLAPISNAMLYRLEHSSRPTVRPEVTYDAVVLLGGVTDERVVAETGQPSYNDNVERLVATHRILADGKARFAIVTGAAMNPSLVDSGEARVLARQIAAWGVDPARIVVEEHARNTRENAVYSQRIAAERGFDRVLLVTSAFHMRRAVECFEAVGMRVDTLPVDYRAHDKLVDSDSLLPRAAALAESSMVLREFFGLYVYRLQGYAKPPRAD